MSIATVSLALVRIPPMRPLPAATEAPTPRPDSPPVTQTPRQGALAQAVSAAALKLVGSESASADGDQVASALNDFTRVLAHTARAVHRGRGDDDEVHRHGHGHGHRAHSNEQAQRYAQWSHPAERMQALASTLGAGDASGAAVVPVESDEAGVAVGEPAPDAVPMTARRHGGHGVAVMGHRLMDAFADLQRAMGLTPSDDVHEQRQALAGFLRDIADELRSASGVQPVEAEPEATGTLLQEAA